MRFSYYNGERSIEFNGCGCCSPEIIISPENKEEILSYLKEEKVVLDELLKRYDISYDDL